MPEKRSQHPVSLFFFVKFILLYTNRSFSCRENQVYKQEHSMTIKQVCKSVLKMYFKRWLFYCTVSGNNGALTFVCYNSLDLLDWRIISYNIKNRALSLSPSISRSSFLYFHTLITTFVTKKQELETMWRSLNIISVAGSLKKGMWCRINTQ